MLAGYSAILSITKIIEQSAAWPVIGPHTRKPTQLKLGLYKLRFRCYDENVTFLSKAYAQHALDPCHHPHKLGEAMHYSQARNLAPNSEGMKFVGAASGSKPTLSIVVPAYNEADNLPALYGRLAPILDELGESWELVLINDGSTDATLDIMQCLRNQDARINIVNLSRNFGKEAATTAGLDHAVGEAVVLLDADLQDPPELIPELVAAWRQGFDTVYAQRRQRHGETWLKRVTAAAFYRILSHTGPVRVPHDTGDFRLISRRVITALGELREHHRFMKGLFAWVGFPSCAISYDRAPRHAGRSAWSYWKLWNLALEGITSFTTAPLRVSTYLGLTIGIGSTFYLLEVITRTLLFGNKVSGYPSLLAVILLLGGTQLFTLGIIGEYLARVFNEVKRRPLYLVEQFQPGYAQIGSDPANDVPTGIFGVDASLTSRALQTAALN